jgi:osmotically-inducible protein OsmY
MEMRSCQRYSAKSAATFLCGSAVGAGAVYLLDPSAGRRRRHVARDRAAGALRRGARRTARDLRFAGTQVQGRRHQLVHRLSRGPAPELDDAELEHKVESIVFRDRSVPKGQISMNAERGYIVLRGQVEHAEMIAHLDEAVRKVRGVRGVENLLHLPGTPPPRRSSGIKPG